MGFFNRKRVRSTEELEEDYERVSMESEVLTREKEVAEKEAAIKELKSRYGPRWRQILGLNKLTDLSTLRSFLKDAKKGMEHATKSGSSPLSQSLNPANFRGIRKA